MMTFAACLRFVIARQLFEGRFWACVGRAGGWKSEESVLVVALRIKGPLERTASLCLRCVTLPKRASACAASHRGVGGLHEAWPPVQGVASARDLRSTRKVRTRKQTLTGELKWH